MAFLGVHFALAVNEVRALREITDEDDRLEYLQEVLEEEFGENSPQYFGESDRSWDAMHRILADGELTWDGGVYPLNHAVLAGELLYTQDDYIMSLKTPDQVKDISAALADMTEGEFRHRYFAINAESYGFPLTEDDFTYTWEWFQNVRSLYELAATESRYVLFTADQ